MSAMSTEQQTETLGLEAGSERPHLRRALNLRLLVFYGLGVTIGAGIYVLIGPAAGRAGIFAPISFFIAAGVMALTASSFAELSCRMPVSAGEAAYVRKGFDSATMSLLVGLMVVTVGSVSAAAISIGSVGYIRVFVDVPASVLVPLVVLAMGLIAAWGVLESVTFAAIMTAIEIFGLLFIVGAGLYTEPEMVQRIPEILSGFVTPSAWPGIVAAGLLAFFAFIGFEDLVNVAEEADDPVRNMPRAIFLTLAISTLLYFAVVAIAVLSVPTRELASAEAPLGLVFERLTGLSPLAISAIAIVATLNGVIVQAIMASRVIYGLAAQGSLPSVFAGVNSTTRTPLVATGLVIAIILTLATAFPLDRLAEVTSQITLIIFTLVNLALARIKLTEETPPPGIFTVPFWIPIAGGFTCVMFLLSGLWPT